MNTFRDFNKLICKYSIYIYTHRFSYMLCLNIRQYEHTFEFQLIEVSNIISSTSDSYQVAIIIIINSVTVSGSMSCSELNMTIYSHDTAVSHDVIASQLLFLCSKAFLALHQFLRAAILIIVALLLLGSSTSSC